MIAMFVLILLTILKERIECTHAMTKLRLWCEKVVVPRLWYAI